MTQHHKTKKPDRLKKRSDFLRAQASGIKWITKGFVLQAATNETPALRAGFTVTKRTCRSAVTRNRIKRRLRALARDILPVAARPGYDYVLIGRAGMEERSFDALCRDLVWALEKTGLNDRTS